MSGEIPGVPEQPIDNLDEIEVPRQAFMTPEQIKEERVRIKERSEQRKKETPEQTKKREEKEGEVKGKLARTFGGNKRVGMPDENEEGKN